MPESLHDYLDRRPRPSTQGVTVESKRGDLIGDAGVSKWRRAGYRAQLHRKPVARQGRSRFRPELITMYWGLGGARHTTARRAFEHERSRQRDQREARSH